jgi:hypothetical protein
LLASAVLLANSLLFNAATGEFGGAATRAKPNRYGPGRNDPTHGIPKHAYSPFDKLDEPPTRPMIKGRDYLAGRFVIKFKPTIQLKRVGAPKASL